MSHGVVGMTLRKNNSQPVEEDSNIATPKKACKHIDLTNLKNVFNNSNKEINLKVLRLFCKKYIDFYKKIPVIFGLPGTPS